MTLSDVAEITVQLITFALVATLSATVIGRVATQVEVRRRLTSRVSGGQDQQRQAADVIRKGEVTNPFLLWVQRSTSLSDAKDQAKLSRDLAMAGIQHPAAPVIYVVLRFGMAIGLPLLFLVWQQLTPKPLVGMPLIVGALILCALGLISPRALLDNRINARKTQLEQEFPDALDLMVVCVEAGLSLEAALVRVGREVDE